MLEKQVYEILCESLSNILMLLKNNRHKLFVHIFI